MTRHDALKFASETLNNGVQVLATEKNLTNNQKRWVHKVEETIEVLDHLYNQIMKHKGD